jgi:hypothetical protein
VAQEARWRVLGRGCGPSGGHPRSDRRRRQRDARGKSEAFPASEAVAVKPIDVAPRRARLLDTGDGLAFATDIVPGEHSTDRTYP